MASSIEGAKPFEKCGACRSEAKCRRQTYCEIREELSELDRSFLKELQAKHPRSAITVKRRFFDGEIGRPFGSVPDDWDGTTLAFEFRMVNPVIDGKDGK